MLSRKPDNFVFQTVMHNKRSMDHIAHLRNQFKSINIFVQSYDYIYCWFRKEKQNNHLFFYNQIVLTFTQVCLMRSLVEFDPKIMQKKIFRSRHFCYFVTFSPLKGTGPLFEETFIPFTQGCFVLCLDKLVQWFLRWRFSNSVNVFSLFCKYLPVERRDPSFKETIVPLTHGCFVLSLVEIGGASEENIYRFF